MIHNIVTDRNGDKHQAVKGDDCDDCSLDSIGCNNIGADCLPGARSDRENINYIRQQIRKQEAAKK